MLLFLAACAAPPPPSATELLRDPAVRALADGLHDYDAGSFDASEKEFRAALERGLADPRDVAAANKYLAFIACAFNRLAECGEHFHAAFVADPAFGLSSAESGHPVWGPVYRRVAAAVAEARKNR